MLILAALVMSFVLVALIAAVADLLVIESESARADSAAFLAAQAGSESVSAGPAGPGVATTGQLQLGPEAVTDCQRAVAVADPGAKASCAVAGNVIRVTVSKPVRLPVGLFGMATTIHAVQQGGAVLGTVRPH